MKIFIVLTAVLVAVCAQYSPDNDPKPYSFNYVAEGEEGTSSHQESADGSGTVRGSYSLSAIDGRNRIVEYVAGPEGFNANIRTNEPGTDNQNPANVNMESTSDTAQLRSAPLPQANRAGATTGQGVRYVLVPITDPRARGYY